MADESAAACVDQKREAPKPTDKAVEEKIHMLNGERKEVGHK